MPKKKGSKKGKKKDEAALAALAAQEEAAREVQLRSVTHINAKRPVANSGCRCVPLSVRRKYEGLSQ